MAHKLVIVARTDLRLSKGKLAAQVGHASVDCALRAQKHAKADFEAWYDEGQKKSVVKVQGEEELRRLMVHARSIGLTTALITDAGHTEIPPGTVTVLGVGPGLESVVDQVTGKLALL